MSLLVEAPQTTTTPRRENVCCPLCGERGNVPFLTAEDDLTGKQGVFRFVTCVGCGLRYQTPRIPVGEIGAWYDDEYIAHRKKTDWGLLTPFYERAMQAHDRRKEAIVRRFFPLGRSDRVLDIGCGAGTFLQRLRETSGASVAGVDFKNLSHLPSLGDVDFRHGLFSQQRFERASFDLITMWHYLEHDYDPLGTLVEASRILEPRGRIVIEVPRLDSLTFRLYGRRWPGLQAPQHTVLFEKSTLLALARKAGLEVVAYLPWGAFPAYFYVFAGAAFTHLRGRGLDLSRAIFPYFAGQLLLSPVLLFERRLNLAMQTLVCRRSA